MALTSSRLPLPFQIFLKLKILKNVKLDITLKLNLRKHLSRNAARNFKSYKNRKDAPPWFANWISDAELPDSNSKIKRFTLMAGTSSISNRSQSNVGNFEKLDYLSQFFKMFCLERKYHSDEDKREMVPGLEYDSLHPITPAHDFRQSTGSFCWVHHSRNIPPIQNLYSRQGKYRIFHILQTHTHTLKTHVIKISSSTSLNGTG